MNSTERRIHAAAMQMFAERGSADLSVSDLAVAAGVARGTLYRNVESIELLFAQVRGQIGHDLNEGIASAMDAAGVVDPPLRLATGIRMLVRLAHENPAMGNFLVKFALTDDSLREVVSGPPMREIALGIKSKRYAVDASMELSVASLLTGSMISAMWLVVEGHQAWREAGAGTAELVLCALGVPRTEARELALAPLPDLPNPT